MMLYSIDFTPSTLILLRIVIISGSLAFFLLSWINSRPTVIYGRRTIDIDSSDPDNLIEALQGQLENNEEHATSYDDSGFEDETTIKNTLIHYDSKTGVLYEQGRTTKRFKSRSQNRRLIDYLFENPNREITVSEVKEHICIGQDDIYLKKVVANLRLEGELKDRVVVSGNNSVRLNI